MKRLVAVAVVSVVVLAGCSSIYADTTPAQPSPSPTPTDAVTITPPPAPEATPTESTQTAVSTPAPTPVPPDNPWASETVTVTIRDRTNSSRDFGPPVNAAVEYWNGRTERYSAYNVTFSFQPDLETGDADVTVVATEPIVNCAGVPETESFAGCYRHEHRVDVYVNQTDLQFRNTAIHELGHALGLDHSDEPNWVMASGDVEFDGSKTNATDRSNPWNTTGPLKLAVGSSLADDGYRSALEAAADTYNRNNNYTPGDSEVVVVDHWYDAHIIVEDSSETEYQFDEPGSIGYSSGLDYDGDPSFEQYTRATVYLNDVESNDAEIHFGYWVGRYMGIDPEDLPDQYRN